MTRLLLLLPARPADPDAALLGRWADHRDEEAFAALVRRHGPAVWGVCRRQLANPADAEDAFQAAFLVLARRADAAPACLGAWLHRVAVLTCRNVRRANRRRPAAALPGDIAVSPAVPAVEVDDLLDRLPERDRRAVVLCHLLGFTLRQAAKQLGIPEGTLSARLSRGLAKLRGHEAALAAMAVPAGLATATGRAVGVWGLSATGVSPAVAGAASGVIRMFWLKKLAAAAVVVVGLVTAGVGVGVSGPVADPPKPAEAKLSAELPAPPLGNGGKLSVRTEAGWVVARYDQPAGFRVWEVVLARADGTTAPRVSADKTTFGLAVEYGRYSVRDNAGGNLRVVRERKPAGGKWPALAAPATPAGSRTAGLYLLPSPDWLWVACGPFGPDLAADRVGQADVVLRLSHPSWPGGHTGTGRVTATIGGVSRADFGDANLFDDGEVLTANYQLQEAPPPVPPVKAAPKADTPNPKLLRPWQLTYWTVPHNADTVSTFALAADAGKLVVPPGGWGWQLSHAELAGDRVTARVTADPAKPADFYLFEGRYDPAADRVYGCLYGRGRAGDVNAAELTPIPAVRALRYREGMVSAFRDPDKPDWKAWMGLHEAWYAGWDAERAEADLLVDAHPADHPARKELVSKRDEARQKAADKLAVVKPLLPVARQVAAAADTRQAFAMTLSLIDFAGVADPTPEELAGWVDRALRFAGRYGDRYRDYLRLKLAGRMQWWNPHPEVALRFADQARAATAADSWPRMEAEGARGHALERLGRAAEAAAAYAEYDRLHARLNGPLANPAEVAAQRAKLGDMAGRLNTAGVHVATLTGRVTTPDGKPVAGATVSYNGGDFDSIRATTDRGKEVRTDAEGRYTVAVRYTGRAMRNASVNVDAPGFVRRNQVRTGLQFLGTMTAVADVTLDPGEPLAGVVRLPLSKLDRDRVTPEEVVWSLVVAGPDGFTGYTDTEPGGRFRIVLKPGRAYTVRVRRFGKPDLEVAGVRPGGPEVVLGWPLGN